eukprot:GHVL01022291.1.p1 GENE.GHVL01022291.1~~GHVL01022291.1.p1  ORF type:complete len:373 (-),score=116.81 GHVL01022291.1:131-1249(-)
MVIALYKNETDSIADLIMSSLITSNYRKNIGSRCSRFIPIMIDRNKMILFSDFYGQKIYMNLPYIINNNYDNIEIQLMIVTVSSINTTNETVNDISNENETVNNISNKNETVKNISNKNKTVKNMSNKNETVNIQLQIIGYSYIPMTLPNSSYKKYDIYYLSKKIGYISVTAIPPKTYISYFNLIINQGYIVNMVNIQLIKLIGLTVSQDENIIAAIIWDNQSYVDYNITPTGLNTIDDKNIDILMKNDCMSVTDENLIFEKKILKLSPQGLCTKINIHFFLSIKKKNDRPKWIGNLMKPISLSQNILNKKVYYNVNLINHTSVKIKLMINIEEKKINQLSVRFDEKTNDKSINQTLDIFNKDILEPKPTER